MTVPELARFLRVSRTTIYRLIEGRKLPFLKVGGVVRFTHGDITAFLNAGYFPANQ